MSGVDKVIKDSQGNITYLLLAELVHGQVALFGIKIRATTYEDGVQYLADFMNKDKGQTFVDVQDMQTLVSVRLIQCLSCGNLAAAASSECPHCKMNFKSPEVVAAIQQGKLRVIQHVEYRLKAMEDGTDNTYRLRPEHVVLYDLIPPDSPAYAKWAETAQLAKAQLREIRSGLVLPTGGQVALLEQERLKRQQKQ